MMTILEQFGYGGLRILGMVWHFLAAFPCSGMGFAGV